MAGESNFEERLQRVEQQIDGFDDSITTKGLSVTGDAGVAGNLTLGGDILNQKIISLEQENAGQNQKIVSLEQENADQRDKITQLETELAQTRTNLQEAIATLKSQINDLPHYVRRTGLDNPVDGSITIGYKERMHIRSGNDAIYLIAKEGVIVGNNFETQGNLRILGNAYKPGGGPWSAPSDIRLKKNVQLLRGALDKLLCLQGVSFEWREPEKHGGLTGPQISLIAQEVEKVFPEWVEEDAEGYKMLTIRGFEALTVEALRELKAENEILLKNNAALEAKITSLEHNLNGPIEQI